MKITKSELKEMIREALREELSNKSLCESVDNLFYVTYEDAYYDGIELCFVSRNNTASEAHWKADIDDFYNAGQNEEFALCRTAIKVDDIDIGVLDRIADKEWDANFRSRWVAANDAIIKYVTTGRVKILDEVGTPKY